MRRITAIVIIIVCSVNTVSAQNRPLVIQGTSPNLYLIHDPVAKENYYSVGRLYNVAPKEIAAYNNLVFENGLRLGQPVKIPLTQNNFIQSQNSPASKVEIPVYHTVAVKEGLYRVSVNYNKVPLEQLKKWNHLSSDAVSSGTKLIVGYLKVQDESIEGKSTAAAKEEAVTPEAKNNTVSKTTSDGANLAPVVKEPLPAAKVVPVSHTSINFNGGLFKKLYEDQQAGKTSTTENGTSGVFKSTSGWRDGKYYCFNNNASVGTIVKITNAANGKSVYAKVLDLIPDISENAGLILHVSNAAAEELGISDTRFDCSINYSK